MGNAQNAFTVCAKIEESFTQRAFNFLAINSLDFFFCNVGKAEKAHLSFQPVSFYFLQHGFCKE